MAQLKDTLIQGSARVTDTLYTATLKPQIIEGGQITAPLSWKDNVALPEKGSAAEFFLAIDSFANGGKTYWVSKANMITALGVNTYLPLTGGTMTGDIKGNRVAALGTTANPFNHIVLGGTTNNVMTKDSTNPRIIFQEGTGTQPVYLIYTDLDSYRFPAGLKVVGGTSATPAWFEVEGDTHVGGSIRLYRNNGTDKGRLHFYSNYKTWSIYMSNAAAGGCPSGGTPSTLNDVTQWALRSYIENANGYGWIWESAAESNTGTPTARMALNANNGNLTVSNHVRAALAPSSWLDGQRYMTAAYDIADYSNKDSYNPWMRATNTWSAGASDAKVGRWFSFGTLGTNFYWMGSLTTRTGNSYDHAMQYDISNGHLRADGKITAAGGFADHYNGTATKLAYSQAGLGYDDYTWLTAWNGYELRAVAKTQFARASHTHSYLPLSGGTLTNDLNFKAGTSDDSPDIVWWYGNNKEQARIWMGSGGTTKFAPNYRCYDSSGNSLYSGKLVIGDGTGASGTWAIGISGNAATATKATQDGNGDTITNKYFQIYNTSYQGNSSAVTVNDLAKQGPAYGMINHATDNPIGSATWVHVLNMGWSKVNTSWIGQIALHTNGTTMYFRGNSSNAIAGKAWNTVLSSNNYSSYALPLSGGTMSGTITLANTGLKTPNAAGFTTDQYGNFKHQSTSTSNTWQLITNAGVAKFLYTWETGDLSISGKLTATNGFVGNLTGAASKLGTATVGSANRGIYLNAGTPTALTWYHNYVTVNSGNTNNYPWHRVATTNLGTGSYVDRDAILFIHSRYSGGKYGVIKISARANNASTDPPAATSVSATWIVRYGFAVGDVRIARKGASGQSAQCDVYVKCGTYMRAYAYLLEGANYNWTLLASNETNNTTADDKKTSIEVYPDVTTSIGAIAYDNVTVAVDGGTVNHANSSDTTTTASNLTNFKVTTTTNLGIDGNGPGTNAIGYVSGLTKAAWNYQQTDGALISQWYNNSWITEIFQDYRTGQLSVRGKNGTSWQPWRRILDETNGATILGLSNYRSDLAPASGAWFRGTPYIGSDGVMEIGKYLDFHAVNTGTADYSARITATTTGLLIDGADNSSTTTQTGKLVLKGSGTAAVGLEFYRGSSASWQILNTSGALQFNTNYTTAAQTTYSKNAISIDYNTLSTTFNGHVIITGTVSGSDTGVTAAYNESLGGPKLIFNDGGQKAYLLGDRYNTSANSLFDFTLGLITSESRGAAFRTNGIKATSRLAVNSNFNSSYNLTVAGPSYFNGTIDIKPDGSGEGGELHLCAAASATAKAGIVLDNLNSNFRIFGIASADGTTKTGVGTALVIDPYAKTITGGYTITGTLDGNATSANTATTATQLSQNTRMDYGWNGLQYFNLSTARSSSGAAKVNETPYTSATWTHIIRCNHANNAGYYTDLAIPFNANGIYYKRVAGGALQNGTTNGGWVNVLDQLNFSNYAIPKSIGTQPGDIIYWSAANTPTRLGKGAAGKFLKMGGSNVPEWGDGSTVSLNGTATTSASFYAPTSAGTNGYYLKSNGSGAPTWAQITTTDKYVNVKVATSPAWTAYLLGTPTQPSGSAEQTSIIPCASANAYISSAGALTAAGVTSNGNITVATNHKIILNGPTTGTTTNAEIARVNSGSQAKLTLGVSSVYTDIGANVLMGAAWNDYAEYRCTTELEAGRCVQENDNGIMTRTEKRLIPGASVVSDTYGFAQGETATAKTPVAVAGRVLVYTYQDRTNYHAGMAVCAAPDGTIDIMTREEIVTYPDCIIGYVSEVPEYSIWGEKAVPVNNRIWIKVK